MIICGSVCLAAALPINFYFFFWIAMSRLLIQNLPVYVTPARLREHFEQKAGPGGIITDAKVALKQDGTSRRFGFIGYKTEKQALTAKEWFHRTFIDSTKIKVDVIEVSSFASSRKYLFNALQVGSERCSCTSAE
jgi:RNA recognition motif-containing protein